MSVLPDYQIRNLAMLGMITPFEPSLINPASIDVRLGPTILLETPNTQDLIPFDISSFNEANPYKLPPRAFILGQTLEVFNIPSFLAAEFKLKSSRAREGINHLLAGFADPGFNGSVMTLEIVNARNYHSVNLWPGMKIGQMIFYETCSTPEKSYATVGHYNGDRVVTPSKGHL